MQEYLVGELVHAKLPQFHIVLEDAHEHLARLSMAYIVFCLDQMRESKDKSSILTREQDPSRTTLCASRPLSRYVLSDGFNHLAYLGPANAGIFKDMETLRALIRRRSKEWNRMCKQVPFIRTGVPWPTLEHDFMFYILVAFASDALLQTFVHHTGLTTQEGINPLVYAAHFVKNEHARVLISQGASVNHPGLIIGNLDTDDPDMDNMAVPLEIAVSSWNVELIDSFLAQRCIVPDRLLAHVLEERPQDFPLSIVNRLLKTAEFAKWSITTPWENRRLLETLVDDVEDHGQVDGGEWITAARILVDVGCAEALLPVAIAKGCTAVIEALLSMDTSSASDVSSVASHTHGASLVQVHGIDLLIYGIAIVNALTPNGDTALHVAVRLSDENLCLAIMKLLVNSGCDPRALDADDKSPIHIAVVRGFISVVEYLLSLNVPLPSRILFSALQVTPSKRVDMIQFLMDRGAKVDILNRDGDTLLHAAMRSLDRSICPGIAKILIGARCSSLARNLNGETPLCVAAKQDHRQIGIYLLLFAAPSDIYSLLHPDPSSQAKALRALICNEDGSRFLRQEEESLLQVFRVFLDDEDKYLAVAKRLLGAPGDRVSDCAHIFDGVVRRGFCLVVEYLLSQCVPLPDGILFIALRVKPTMVPFLISKGADLHATEKNGDTLLHAAMTTLKQEAECHFLVQAFVEAGCPTSRSNDSGKSPIDAAVSLGYFSVVEYLLSQDTPLPNGILFTALQNRGQPSMVRFLIHKGADLHARDRNGDTLIHAAIGSPGPDEDLDLITMRVLLGAGCHPSESNHLDRSPIDVAVSRGCSSTVEYLLSEGTPLPRRILFTALEKSVWMVPFLLRKGADLHAKKSNGDTLLHIAMRIRNEAQCLKTTKLLVVAGCHSSGPNNAGQLPIQVAVSQGLASVVEYLLSQHVPLPNRILFTALRQQVSMVPFLLHRGADVHVREDNGGTLLHAAMSLHEESQCHVAVQALVQAGCLTSVSNSAGILPVHLAISQGFISVVQYLLSLDQHDSLPLDLLLSVSPCHNSSSMVRLLVDHGANVGHQDTGGDGPLHHVMQFSDEEECLMATQSLLQAGCRDFRTNSSQKSPLHIAVQKQFTSVVDYMVVHDVPLPPDILPFVLQWSPIHEGYHKWKSMVFSLIRKGANIHARETYGDTLMHYAMRLSWERRSLVATKLLLEAGCSPSVWNTRGELPIQIAVSQAFYSVVECLLSHNAPFPPDILLIAVRVTQVPQMISLLVRNGANVSVCATNGDSVLHVAIAVKRSSPCCSLMEIVKALVREGCDPEARNSRGHTPLEVAVNMGYPEVRDYLRTIVLEQQRSFGTPLPNLSLPAPDSNSPHAPANNSTFAPPLSLSSSQHTFPSPPPPSQPHSPPSPSSPSLPPPRRPSRIPRPTARGGGLNILSRESQEYRNRR